MREQRVIPVYMITGFIESGKTTMIQSMLTDEGFTTGQKTLIICCEEGETELDSLLLKRTNTVQVNLEEADELTSLKVKQLNNEHRPERVIIEFNSFWGIEMMARVKMPPQWELVQIICLADGTTFENYMTNMRKQLTDPMKPADLILINRCAPDFDKSKWRKQLRALNPSATILFENPDGSTEDGVSDEDLPYDVKADVIDISEDNFGILYLDAMDHSERYDGKVLRRVGQPFPDEQFPDGIFYLDSMDHPGRYHGKTVRVTGQVFPDASFPPGFYYFARYAMTCCANDIAKCGWVCRGKEKPSEKGFIRLTAKAQVVTSPDGQPAIMLHELSTEKAAPPKEKYVTFGTV